MKPATATNVKKTAYPSALSISELISAYPRERLFVHPLLWTRRHLGLLGCEFSDDGILSPPPSPTTVLPSPTHNQSGIGNDNKATWVERHFAEQYSDTNKARCLATSERLHDKCWSLTQLLKEFECYRDQVRFRFACRVVANLPCKYLALSSQSPSPRRGLAQLGYLHLAELARHRRIKLSRRSNNLGPPNPQDLHYIQKQLRLLTPNNRYEDPYLVALLIALAQKQAQGQRLGDRDRDNINDDDARHKLFGGATNVSSQMLLVTSPGDTTWLHIYTSNISPEFLDKLDRPSRPSRPPPADTDTQSRLGMVISHRRLAFEPYGTLSQRLTAVVQQTIGKDGYVNG
ncbi:hypothetical protein B0T21DRAFT_366758 [Apiosordaria backusii]|uniref:Uncharacterized protein n=1 Tax=Apiosordaria backusii TaxID=314023 RepID=A0AA40BLC5_9PEZI|nr:hypothetical protein B0T21DRAFT_366758 [Apiosordaria backusii]